MKKSSFLILFASFFFIVMSSLVFSERLDSDQEKALSDVMDLLKSPVKRQSAIDSDPKAKEADRFLKEWGGNQSEDIYELAAQIFQSLALEAGGDADKMAELLSKAQKDPESFAKKLSPAQKERLKKIVGKIQKSKSVP